MLKSRYIYVCFRTQTSNTHVSGYTSDHDIGAGARLEGELSSPTGVFNILGIHNRCVSREFVPSDALLAQGYLDTHSAEQRVRVSCETSY